MMLDAVTLKRSRAAIVTVHRQSDIDRALRIHQPVAIVVIDAQIIGDDLKLVAGHLKNFVVVNRHEAKAEPRISAKKTQMLFASEIRSVKLKPQARLGSTIPSEFVTSALTR